MNKRFFSGMAALALVLGVMAPMSAAADDEYDLEGNFTVDEGAAVDFGGFTEDGDTDDDEYVYDADVSAETPAASEEVFDGDCGIVYTPKVVTPKIDVKKTAPKVYNPLEKILPDECVAFEYTDAEFVPAYGWAAPKVKTEKKAKHVCKKVVTDTYFFSPINYGYLTGGVDYGKPTQAQTWNWGWGWGWNNWANIDWYVPKAEADKKAEKKETKKPAKKVVKCKKEKRVAPVVFTPVTYAPTFYAPASFYKAAATPFNTWCKCFGSFTVPKKTSYFGKFCYKTFNFKKLEDPKKV